MIWLWLVLSVFAAVCAGHNLGIETKRLGIVISFVILGFDLFNLVRVLPGGLV